MMFYMIFSFQSRAGDSIGRYVGPSDGYIYFRLRILLFRGLQGLITAPAHPHATKIAVYTALFITLLNADAAKKFNGFGHDFYHWDNDASTTLERRANRQQNRAGFCKIEPRLLSSVLTKRRQRSRLWRGRRAT